jgi:integrase
MAKHKTITDATAKRLKAPKEGQVDHFDSSLPGLALRVSSSGRKTWTYFYRIGGKLRRMSFDVYPAMSVSAAHGKWLEARDLVQAGRDPTRAAVPGATDFRVVAEEWLRRDQEGNRTRDTVEKALKREVLPHWGHREITDIKRRDVLALIDGIADRGTIVMARRIHGHLHRLFRWSVGRGIIEQNPMQDLPKPGSETRRDRVLTDDELIKVWRACDELGPYGHAIRLLILTGARREEIGRLRWSELTGDGIELEGARTKNGEARIIPLSTAAQVIIQSLPHTGDFVFTAGLPDWSRAKSKLDDLVKIPTWRTHDLRRKTATGLQKLGIALQVTEAILGHTAGSRAGVFGIYQRHDYAPEKRAALEAWGAHVMALVEGQALGKVLPMRGNQ